MFEPYTREMFEQTRKWVLSWNIFDEENVGRGSYEDSVAAASS